MTALETQRELAARILAMGRSMVETRATSLGDDAIRQLPVEVAQARWLLLEDGEPRLLDAEAACVVELLIALTYARAAKDARRESRLICFLNPFLSFMDIDLHDAAKEVRR
jgi:hypothetical protein